MSASTPGQWVRGQRGKYYVDKGALLGKGGYGSVFRAVRVSRSPDEPPILVAAKRISARAAVAEAHLEIRLLCQLPRLDGKPHPNLVELLDFHLEEDEVWIFFEYLSAGSLQDYLDPSRPLSEPSIALLTRDALCGLQHLHLHGILHRDMKPANMLLSEIGTLKLADFGLAKLTADPTSGRGGAGTHRYMSPEAYDDRKYSTGRDVYALGASVVQMARGSLPKFPGCQGRYPEPPVSASESLKDFCRCCLAVDPQQRWNCTELLRHEFIALAIVEARLPMPPLPAHCLIEIPSDSAPDDEDDQTEARVLEYGTLDQLAQSAPKFGDFVRDTVEGRELAVHIRSLRTRPMLVLRFLSDGVITVTGRQHLVLGALYHPSASHFVCTDGAEGRSTPTPTAAGEWALSFQAPSTERVGSKVLYYVAGNRL